MRYPFRPNFTTFRDNLNWMPITIHFPNQEIVMGRKRNTDGNPDFAAVCNEGFGIPAWSEDGRCVLRVLGAFPMWPADRRPRGHRLDELLLARDRPATLHAGCAGGCWLHVVPVLLEVAVIRSTPILADRRRASGHAQWLTDLDDST